MFLLLTFSSGLLLFFKLSMLLEMLSSRRLSEPPKTICGSQLTLFGMFVSLAVVVNGSVVCCDGNDGLRFGIESGSCSIVS